MRLPRYFLICLLAVTACGDHDGDNTDVITIGGNPQHTGVYETTALRNLSGVRWIFPTDTETTGAPVIWNGVVYTATVGGVLHAVDVATGEAIWSFDAGNKLYNGPTIHDGVAYLGCSNGSVYAIEIANETRRGKTRWQFETGSGICYPPAIHNGIAYAGNHERQFYQLDVRTGEEVGRIEEDHDVCCCPTIYDNHVYYVDWGGNLHELDPTTGRKELVFSTDKKTKWFTSPAIVNGVAYFVDYDSVLYAVDVRARESIWRFEADGRISRAPVVNDHVVCFTTTDSHLYTVDVNTGEMLWDLRTTGVVYCHPAVAEDVVYFGSGDHNLYALDIDTGKGLWRFESDAPVGTPLPLDGVVYVCSGNNLYALE